MGSSSISENVLTLGEYHIERRRSESVPVQFVATSTAEFKIMFLSSSLYIGVFLLKMRTKVERKFS